MTKFGLIMWSQKTNPRTKRATIKFRSAFFIARQTNENLFDIDAFRSFLVSSSSIYNIQFHSTFAERFRRGLN